MAGSSLLVSYWTLAFVRVITAHAPVGILDDYERAGIRSNASPRAPIQSELPTAKGD